MGNTNTHKVCSLPVEVLQKREFRFLVPNHLVNEDGIVDDKVENAILYKIDHQFVYGELGYDNLEEPHHNSIEVKGDISVTSLDEVKEGFGLPIFGDEE
jgi:hypothetical protein